jgi:hypothetical protein
MSADHDPLNPDPHSCFCAVHEDDHSTVPPLEHAAMEQMLIAHADPQLFLARLDDSFVDLGRIITEVLGRISAACEWTGDVPYDDAGPFNRSRSA